MNITDFDLRNVDLTSRVFHSEAYGEDFPLIAPERIYVKFSPVQKEDVKKFFQKLKIEMPGRSFNISCLDSEEFYKSRSFHQFYRLINELTPTERLLHYFFRNADDDKSTDDYLNIMHESSILRQCADCKTLDEKIKSEFRREFQDSISDCEELFGSSIQDFEYLGKKNMFKSYLENRMSIIFDSLTFMISQGYRKTEFFEIASRNRIYPYFKYQNNVVIEKVKAVVLS